MTSAESPRVLQVGNVAGVADGISMAMDEYSRWSIESVGLSELAAGAHPAMRAVCWPVRAMASRRTVRRQVRAVGPELVHLHWARYAPFVTTAPTPLIVHAHGSDVRGRRGTVLGRVVERSLERAAVVLAATPDLLDDLPTGAVHLPNPVDTERFRPTDSDPDRYIRVLIFAKLTDIKGADIIIDAARQIRRARPSVSIAAIAGGTHDAVAAEAGIELIGPFGRAALVEQLQAATIVVGQQRLGSLGLSELEAMSCARPVIARVRLDMYDEPPPICSVNGAAELTASCLALIDSPADRHALGLSARSFVARHHSHRVVVGRLSAIYDRLGSDT